METRYKIMLQPEADKAMSWLTGKSSQQSVVSLVIYSLLGEYQ